MLCDNCKISSVCKIHDFIKANANTTVLTVQSCQLHSEGAQPAVNQPRQVRSMDELQEAVQKLKAIEKKQHVQVDTDEGLCPTCGTPLENITQTFPCDGCGKEICDACATSTIDHKVLCEDCYDKEDAIFLKD